WAGINKEIIQALYSLGFDAIQVSMGKPNSVDVKIAVDCLETAQLYPEINCFILLTGDKDFISLVTALKANRRKVIIIGDTHNVSEHLLLSADDFLSLEELSKMYKTRDFSKLVSPKKKEKTIPFDTAVDWLIETIKFAREQGKTTRRALIDNLMRSSPNFDYKGASMVQDPNDKTNAFNSFSKFVSTAEEKGKIKTEIVEGFMEIFLPDEDPHVDSELSPNLKDEIEKEDWKTIFKIIIDAYTTGKNEDKQEHKYSYLHNILRSVKKEGLLPYSNRKLSDAINKLKDVGFLISQSASKFTLTEDYNEKLEKYLQKVIISKK
ncbi:MAG: NYN domain-containing protein, partial [Promethearchaeota archaeon]